MVLEASTSFDGLPSELIRADSINTQEVQFIVLTVRCDTESVTSLVLQFFTSIEGDRTADPIGESHWTRLIMPRM